MQALLELILKNITTYPDEVSLEMANEEGREVYTIKVHPDDMGRVIGKAGKVIQAIRSIAHVVAIRQNKRIRINLADSGLSKPIEESETPSTVPEDTDVDLISGAIDLKESKAKLTPDKPSKN